MANTLVTFMRENYPDIVETISYQIPTYNIMANTLDFLLQKAIFPFILLLLSFEDLWD
jgi:hypothetical protein